MPSGPTRSASRPPSFNALAARGRRFRQAYATVPETLPSHASMMTGLYPAGHGVHENGRHLPDATPVLAERLQQAGLSDGRIRVDFVLARRFGLARGFDVYDDELAAGRQERTAPETTDAALAELDARRGRAPVPLGALLGPASSLHAARAVPERASAAARISAKWRPWTPSSGAWSQAFEQRRDGAGRHHRRRRSRRGAGRSRRGAARQPALPVDDARAARRGGPGRGARASSDAPVSTRRVFHTVLDWAGARRRRTACAASRRTSSLGEAMKPFLNYGWQPQIMAVEGRHKSIFAGTHRALRRRRRPGRGARPRRRRGPSRRRCARRSTTTRCRRPRRPRAPAALERGGPRRSSPAWATSAPRRRPSCGRTRRGRSTWSASSTPLEEASTLFVQAKYAQVIPLLEQILAEDRYNLDATLRLATAHSALGHEAKARRGVPPGRRACAPVGRRPDVPGVALRAGQGLGPGGARCSSRSWPTSPDRLPARRRRSRCSASGRDGSKRRSACCGTSTSCGLRRRRSWCSSARWRWRPGRRTRPSTRSSARGPTRGRRSAHDLELGRALPGRRAGSRTRAPRSTACPRRTRRTRWRSSSAPR